MLPPIDYVEDWIPEVKLTTNAKPAGFVNGNPYGASHYQYNQPLPPYGAPPPRGPYDHPGAPFGGMPGAGGVGGGPLQQRMSVSGAGGQGGGQQPQGMFTRNLIGSLVCSAFRLTDTNDKIGIWFVMQDLSVRTEGVFRCVSFSHSLPYLLTPFPHSSTPFLTPPFSLPPSHSPFLTPLDLPPTPLLLPPPPHHLYDLLTNTKKKRLQLSFVNVGHPTPMGPTSSTTTSSGGSTAINQSKAPILASVFSEPFQVFSAKKFPGVCDSTALSKCFATQGIKIPIRKEGANSKNNEDDDDY